MDSEKVEGERSCFTSNTVGWGVSTKAEVRNAAFDIVGLKKKNVSHIIAPLFFCQNIVTQYIQRNRWSL